jgi:hypothetical protein
MALKTDMIPSSAKGFRLIGKLYRWVGWFGVALSVMVSFVGFISEWNRAVTSTSYYSYMDPVWRFLQPFALALMVFFCGLTLCALAFLVSAIIDTCVNITENNRARTEVLRRIVREQSDVQ